MTAISPSRPIGISLAPATSSLALAAEHFAAATLYLLAGAAGLVWAAPELAAGAYLSPHVAGVVHLFTLGWLTMTIFGALCQLLPVALGLGLIMVGALAAALAVGLGVIGVTLTVALGVVMALSPIWIPVLVIIGRGALCLRLARS